MRNIFSFDCRENVRHIVKKMLKDDYGIKVPKDKSSKTQTNESHLKGCKVFGVPLENVFCENVGNDCYCPIPRFLVEAVTFLEPHLKTEGLFRKSGSLARQKTIRHQVDNGGSCITDIAQPHDIAGMIKQFFRELPESVMTSSLHGTFMKCLQLNTPNEQVMSILMTCLLLPDTNLRLLQYLCQFVSKVAAHSEESKMTLNNLAIILSPNLMFTCRDKDSDKYVKEQTEVVDILFKNANSIGWVNDEVLEKVNGMEGETCSISTSSADELEVAMVSRQRRNRRRSRSISGFVNGIGRKFKGTSNASGCASGNEEVINEPRRPRHRRTISDKNTDLDRLTEKRSRCENDGIPFEYCVNSPYPKPGLKSLKRRAGVHRSQGQTPRRQSPRLSRRADSCQIISTPTLLSMPTQFLLASKSSFIPVMRSQEDVRTDDLHADAYATERMSPSLVSSTASLDADLLNTKAADKENMRQSKYSIVREKYLQKYMRSSSVRNYTSPWMNSKEKLFNTPNKGAATNSLHVEPIPDRSCGTVSLDD